MIKFFRKIRERLLSEYKFGKYLIYAVGEIVLVVIGILIALQVNNWNENQKRNKDELEYLKRLKRDIELSIEQTQSGTQFMLTAANHSTLLIENLNNCSIPETDQKDFAVGMFMLGKLSPPVLIKGTINELQSTGKLLSIRNVELREQLTNVIGEYEKYSVLFPHVLGFVIPHQVYISEKVSFKIDSPKQRSSKIEWNDAIFDLDEICRDRKSMAAVLALRNYTFDVIGWNQIYNENLESFKDAIEKELQKKKK